MPNDCKTNHIPPISDHYLLQNMATLLQFSAKPQSRHPKHFPLAYNKVTHKYSSKYVNPEKWGIEITHALLKERTDKQSEAAKINPNPNKSTYEALMAQKAALQDRVREINTLLGDHEIRFNVKSADGSFSKDTKINDYTPVVEVPKTGAYTVTIKVKNKSGQTETKSSNINFLDIVVVSLGDSYAAGEGNPDVSGTPNETMIDYAEKGAAATLENIKEDMQILTSHIPNVTPELEFAEWQEPMAHRSYRSGHSMAAERIEGKYASRHLVATFLPLARSGAKSDEGLIKYNAGKTYNERQLRLEKKALGGFKKHIKEYERPGSLDYRLQIGQIEEAKMTVKNRQIDFLIVSIGGNDIRWSSNFGDLISFDSELSLFVNFIVRNKEIPISSGESGDERGRKELEEKTKRELAKLPAKFEALDKKIKETLNPRFVLIAEYPTGFFGATDKNGKTVLKADCSIFKTIADADIDFKDARLVRDLSDQLNEQVKLAAKKHNWILVDGIADEFGKHGNCAEESYFVSAEQSFKTQGDWNGMFHPNAKGHNLYAKRIAEKIKETIAANPTIFK